MRVLVKRALLVALGIAVGIAAVPAYELGRRLLASSEDGRALFYQTMPNTFAAMRTSFPDERDAISARMAEVIRNGTPEADLVLRDHAEDVVRTNAGELAYAGDEKIRLLIERRITLQEDLYRLVGDDLCRKAFSYAPTTAFHEEQQHFNGAWDISEANWIHVAADGRKAREEQGLVLVNPNDRDGDGIDEIVFEDPMEQAAIKAAGLDPADYEGVVIGSSCARDVAFERALLAVPGVIGERARAYFVVRVARDGIH